MSRLVTDPALRAAQGHAARAAMAGRSWPARCDELIGHYRDVLEARTPALAPAAPVTTTPTATTPAAGARA